jgi:hypothetical protein
MTNRLHRRRSMFPAERLVSPTERSIDLREKGAPPLNGLRSNAALALPRKSLRSVQSVLPCWALTGPRRTRALDCVRWVKTERMPETCFSPQQLLCLHTETAFLSMAVFLLCENQHHTITQCLIIAISWLMPPSAQSSSHL